MKRPVSKKDLSRLASLTARAGPGRKQLASLILVGVSDDLL